MRVEGLTIVPEPPAQGGRHPRVDVLEERLRPLAPVELVTDDRMADRGEMHAELVLPSGLGEELEHRVLACPCDDAEASARVEPVVVGLAHLHHDVQAFANGSHRKVDRALVLAHHTLDDREVRLFDLAIDERLLQRSLGVEVLAAHDEAARLAVEAVRDVGRRRPIALAEQKRERVTVIRGGRMHGQPRGLVDAEDVIVLVDDVEGQRRLGLLEPRADEQDDLPRAEPIARATLGAVRSVRAGVHDLLGARPRQPRNARLQEAIEPLASELASDGEREDDRVGLAPFGKGFGQPVALGGLGDAARADAPSADPHAAGTTVDRRTDRLQVRVLPLSGLDVRVAHLVSLLRGLTADFARVCHDVPRPTGPSV